MLTVKELTVNISGIKIVDGVSFSVAEKQWLMVVGPNGAGKSTMLNAISQCVPYSGSVTFDGRDTAKLKAAELAKCMGVLTQNNYIGYPFTVEEIVKLGRYSYSSGIFSSPDEQGEQMIKRALEMTGMLSLARQSALTLSGGELQRTFLAQVFAQNPRMLILDEPANHLDLVYQKQIFDLINSWITYAGRAVVSVVHDLSLARMYGTNAMLMNKGKLVSIGKISEVLTREALHDVYSMDVYAWMQKKFKQWE